MLLSLGRGTAPARGILNREHSTPLIDSVIPSCVFDLDATIAESYPGSGYVWHNLAAAPADSAASSDYDFYLGTTGTTHSSVPGYVGEAGSRAAYFTFDGTDDTITLPAGFTPFLRDLPKTTGGSLPVTMAFAFRSTIESGGRVYMGSWQGTFPTVRVQFLSSQAIRIQQGNGSAFVQSDPIGMTSHKNYVVIISLAPDGTWTARINGIKITGNLSLVNTTANAGAFRLMNSAGAGLRLYAASLFNEVLNDQEASALLNLYQNRHNRLYQ